MEAMKSLPAIATAALLQAIPIMAADAPITLVIHGGAGIARKDLPPEKEAACRKVLEEALNAGHEVLRAGGTSLDAVQSAIVVLEDSPLFNAGRGAVFTYNGLGRLMVDAVAKRDVPVVQACGLIFAIVFIGLNMIADVLSIPSNPRLRHPR